MPPGVTELAQDSSLALSVHTPSTIPIRQPHPFGDQAVAKVVDQDLRVSAGDSEAGAVRFGRGGRTDLPQQEPAAAALPASTRLAHSLGNHGAREQRARLEAAVVRHQGEEDAVANDGRAEARLIGSETVHR